MVHSRASAGPERFTLLGRLLIGRVEAPHALSPQFITKSVRNMLVFLKQLVYTFQSFFSGLCGAIFFSAEYILFNGVWPLKESSVERVCTLFWCGLCFLENRSADLDWLLCAARAATRLAK